MTSVDTKPLDVATFGNDARLGEAVSDSVVTKSPGAGTFGNYTGFVRVRKRKLKGGHPDWRRLRHGTAATASASFDLVRAVRVNGKPRHQFVLGLGSQKTPARDNDLFWFWHRARRTMERHGFDAHQRRELVMEMVRKSAVLPSLEICESWRRRSDWEFASAPAPEIEDWIRGQQS